MPAPFIWYDLTTAPDRTEGAIEFYAALFGWSINAEPTESPYAGWVMDGDQPRAAIVANADRDDGCWVPFVKVDDLDSSTVRALELGAVVISGPTRGPAGTAVTITDPAGATVALWTPHPVTS